MACHVGRNSRLDDQLAEPGFLDIDDRVTGSTVRVGGGREPEHSGGAAGADPSASAGDERCPFPAGHGTHAFSLSTRAGPSLSPPRNDSPPAKQLP